MLVPARTISGLFARIVRRRRTAQCLDLRCMALSLQPLPPRGGRDAGRFPRLGRHGCLTDEGDQPLDRLLPIAGLTAESPRRDHNLTLTGQASSRELQQPRTHLFADRRRAGGVEADLNGCRRLVDMLAAWSARCDKDLFDFRFLNRDRIGDLDHDPPPPGLCCPRTTPARVLRRKGAGVTGARYAVYFAPAEDSALNRLASRWLGRCAYTGTRYPPTGIGEITPAAQEEITAEPRRYGFHATLKPPFRLPQGR